MNFELWLEMDGYSIKSLKKDPRFPHTPDIRTLAHNFREPTDLGESYASRLYAWFAPPETGNYQFLICMYDDTKTWDRLGVFAEGFGFSSSPRPL